MTPKAPRPTANDDPVRVKINRLKQELAAAELELAEQFQWGDIVQTPKGNGIVTYNVTADTPQDHQPIYAIGRGWGTWFAGTDLKLILRPEVDFEPPTVDEPERAPLVNEIPGLPGPR